MSELLPCPFCGGAPGVTLWDHTPVAHIQCGSCSARTAPFGSAEVAAEWWNRRVEVPR